MARAVLFAISFSALASGARYVDDYSGVKMPEYGVEVADYQDTVYRDRSLDAHVPSDYKYEEDSVDQRVTRRLDDNSEAETANSAVIQKSKRRQKRPSQSFDDANFYSQKMNPKFKRNNQHSIQRQRIDTKNFEREVDVPYNRHSKYVTYRNDIDRENNFDINQDGHERKRINFNEEKSVFISKVSTERVKKARRKPRDKYVKDQSEDDIIDNSEYNMLVGKKRNEGGSDIDYPAGHEGRRIVATDLNKEDKSDLENPDPSDNNKRWNMAEHPNTESVRNKEFQTGKEGRRFRPLIDNDSEHRHMPEPDYFKGKSKLRKLEPKTYDKYYDYYDMKRVYNIKKNPPSLLRQTTIATKSVPELQLAPQPVEWPYRRANIMAPIPRTEKTSTDIPTTSITTTTTTTTVTTTTKETTVQWSTVARKDLSLEEKSRLSILKKAQRKETMSNETATKKPPVLVQVAKKMQTVIMVEPPKMQESFPLAREVSGDTPERLDHVKRLMRQKLLANAKNIHDLTDNWDEMVCDYVDVSLLENSTTTKNLSLLVSAYALLCFVFEQFNVPTNVLI